MTTTAPPITPDILRPMVAAGLTRNQIAEQLGVHPNKLNYPLKRLREMPDEPAESATSPVIASVTVMPAPPVQDAPPETTLQKYIIKVRRGLKNTLGEDDEDRRLLQLTIGSPLGARIRARVDAGDSLKAIRREWSKCRREYSKDGQELCSPASA